MKGKKKKKDTANVLQVSNRQFAQKDEEKLYDKISVVHRNQKQNFGCFILYMF